MPTCEKKCTLSSTYHLLTRDKILGKSSVLGETRRSKEVWESMGESMGESMREHGRKSMGERTERERELRGRALRGKESFWKGGW